MRKNLNSDTSTRDSRLQSAHHKIDPGIEICEQNMPKTTFYNRTHAQGAHHKAPIEEDKELNEQMVCV